MNIVFISTWRTECGIATYTEYLANALRKLNHKVYILAERIPPTQAYIPKEENTFRTWDRRAAYESPLGLYTVIRAIESSETKPDIVHIQHEFGLFPHSPSLWTLIEELQKKNIKVFITLHTVEAPPKRADFFLNTNPDKLTTIVHTNAANTVLASWSSLTPIVIPHGSSIETPLTKMEARKLLEIPQNNILALCPGFMNQGKGQETILHACATALSIYPTRNFNFAMVGACRNELYLNKIEDAISSLGLSEHIIFRPQFQPDHQRHLWFSAADFVILSAGENTPYSASGQLHTAIGYGLPVLAKNVPIYQQAGVLLYKDVQEAALYIRGILRRPSILEQLAVKAREVAQKRSWEVTAERHVELYKK